MISRRNILARILAAPVVASAAKEAVAAVEPLESDMPVYASTTGQCPEPSPTSKAYQRAMDALRKRRDRSDYLVYATEGKLPPHIANKRSWSPAFKAAEAWKEREAIDNIYSLGEGDLIALARKMGVI